MLALVSEFLGTFFFLSAVLVSGKAIPIVITLLAAIFVFGAFSGAHFNSAITVMMMVAKKISVPVGLMYIVAQILGGLSALVFYNLSSGYVIAPVISL